jgi:ATP-dependent exoDNAse (exonuclease V) beta subunit
VYAAREALEHLASLVADVALAPYAAGYRELLGEYAAAFAALKKESGVIDFEDAVESVAALLEERRDIAAEYRHHFAAIMIDEFQDTDALQMRAVDALRDENLCVVGDMHQSIYGFRFADVGVMRALIDEIGPPISMHVNYRSHPDVLRAVNALFEDEAFFGDASGALEPGRTGDGGVPWPDETPHVEMHVVDRRVCRAGERPQREAKAIAARARALLDEGAAPDDIVVLLRGMTHAPTIAHALRSLGVPVHVASGERLFESPEVTDVRALLRAIVVPTDDAAMVRVLAGPVSGVGDDMLLAIRQAAGTDSLWEGMVTLAEKGVAEVAALVRSIKTLRRRMGAQRLGDFVHDVLHEFDYDLTLLAAGPQGVQAWANTTKLIRMAEEFERAHRGDVGAYLAYLDDYDRYVSREPVASMSGASGAVRIMSIHAAKGLEFPIVVLGDMGRKLAESCSGPFLVDRLDGEPVLAVEHPKDASALEGVKDTLFAEVRAARDEAEAAEQRRLLYVAMTRAENALILVGTADPECQEKRTASDLVLAALGYPDSDSVVEIGEGRLSLTWHAEELSEGTAEGAAKATGAAAAETGAPRLQLEAVESGTALPDDVGDRGLETISYSAFQTFERCQRRFYVTHVLGMRGLGQGDSPALRIGSAVHQALQAQDPLAATPRVARRFGLGEAEEQRLLNAVESFAISPLRKRIAEADEAHAEWPLAVDLGETMLVGSMDLVARDGDEVLIVDYKTGQDREAAQGEQRMAGYRLQARCYALAALRDGARRVRVVFAFVEQAMESVEFTFAAEEATTIEAELGQRLQAISHSDLPHLDAYDPALCSDCEASGVFCPIRQP